MLVAVLCAGLCALPAIRAAAVGDKPTGRSVQLHRVLDAAVTPHLAADRKSHPFTAEAVAADRLPPLPRQSATAEPTGVPATVAAQPDVTRQRAPPTGTDTD